MAHSRKAVKIKTNDPKKNVKNSKEAIATNNIQVWFDLHDTKWLSSVKTKRFTNFLDTPESCLKSYYTVLKDIIPKVQLEWDNILGRNSGYRHCHLLTHEKELAARNIYNQIYNHSLDDGMRIWQFGFSGSTRLICIHNDSSNALMPIFVDHHHHIYENEKYNDKDFRNYKYCMICGHK